MHRLRMITVVLLAAVPAVILALASVSDTAADEEQKTPAERAREDFELMRLFADAYEQIDSHYVSDVDRRKLVEAAIRGMVSHLDAHSMFVGPADLKRFEQHVDQEFVGIGIAVNTVNGRLEVVSPLPDSPAFKAGVRTGDLVQAIDGQPVSGLSQAEFARLLTGPAGRPVELSLLRPVPGEMPAEPVTITVIRSTVSIPTVVGFRRQADLKWQYRLDDPRIGYLRITHFSRKTPDELREVLDALLMDDGTSIQALIIDVRSNPGGLMDAAVEIADQFLDTGRIVSMKGRSVPERTWKARRGDTIPAIPVAVLVNRQSASASEVLSASLQDHQRASIVGERTFGKGSVQTIIDLEAGRSALKLTTATYFRPSGVNIHRFPDATADDDWGVHPTEGCSLTLDKEQWTAWVRYREAADNHNTVAPDGTLPEFADAQLNLAAEKLITALQTPPHPAAN